MPSLQETQHGCFDIMRYLTEHEYYQKYTPYTVLHKKDIQHSLFCAFLSSEG